MRERISYKPPYTAKLMGKALLIVAIWALGCACLAALAIVATNS